MLNILNKKLEITIASCGASNCPVRMKLSDTKLFIGDQMRTASPDEMSVAIGLYRMICWSPAWTSTTSSLQTTQHQPTVTITLVAFFTLTRGAVD